MGGGGVCDFTCTCTLYTVVVDAPKVVVLPSNEYKGMYHPLGYGFRWDKSEMEYTFCLI